MAIDITLEDITSGYNLSKINSNFDAVEVALQDAVSLSGSIPNSMNSDFDMNGFDVLNGGSAKFDSLVLNGVELVDSLVAKGDAGWSPVLAVVTDSLRRVLQIIGYVGGEGTAPSTNVGYYITATGVDPNITNAVDIRGAQGASGAGTGDMLASQNLNDVASKPTAFANIKQAATTAATGVIQIAQNSDVSAGTSSVLAITPSTFMQFYISQNMGKVFDFTGTSAPALHIFPFGQAISRTTYSAYFAQVGTTYGAGDGSTTFNVLDLRGRVSAGKDNMGGVSANRLIGVTGSLNGDAIGATGGEEAHQLALGELAKHHHIVTSTGSAWGANKGNPPAFRADSGDSFSGTNFSMTSNDQGNDFPHNNVQPTIIMNKVLFVGV